MSVVKKITWKPLFDRLAAEGIIPNGGRDTYRVVIDATVGEICLLTIYNYGDERLLDAFGEVTPWDVESIDPNEADERFGVGLGGVEDEVAVLPVDGQVDGLGASAAEVPDAEVIAAANICDEAVPLAAGGSATLVGGALVIVFPDFLEDAAAYITMS